MRRLTGLDASFLYLETPNNHMHVAGVYVFDPSEIQGGYSFERCKEVIGNRLHRLPPFRWRLVEVPFGLHHPIWIEDPDFDIDYHVRRAALPAPGGREELAAFAADVMSRQLDRRRPLWEVHVVEGLEHGYVAMVSKTHHAAIDGASGAELSANLLDLGPEPVVYDEPDWKPERVPSDGEMLVYALNSLTKQPAQFAKTLKDTVETALSLRSRAKPEGMAPPPSPFTAPRTSLNGPITPHRSFAMTEVNLADVKRIRAAFGGTVNDIVLAICAGALRQYLIDGSELPMDPLVAMVPMSVRASDQKGAMGNRITNMFVALPTQLADPVERLQTLQEGTKAAKEQATAIGAEALSNWAEFAAPAVAARAARLYASMKLADRHRPMMNVTISNVPGPQFPLYSVGAKLVSWYPMGPIFDGSGLNMTVMSYLGVVYFGLVACKETVPRVDDLARYVADAASELVKAAETAVQAPASRDDESSTVEKPSKTKAKTKDNKTPKANMAVKQAMTPVAQSKPRRAKSSAVKAKNAATTA